MVHTSCTAYITDPNLAHYVFTACILWRTLHAFTHTFSSCGAPESAGNREDKLRHRGEREWARRASEAVEQREKAENTKKEGYRARHAAHTVEDRAAGLQQIRHRRDHRSDRGEVSAIERLPACKIGC